MYGRGNWICQDCGETNECTDDACECQHVAEHREYMRRAAIERMAHISPRERRERLRRVA